MSVIPFKDEADALEIANATPYGLAAAVWTRDIFKAFRVVKALEAGIVWVNHMQPTMLEAPWGGYKMSGFGRELGHWGVEEYLETKQIYINLDEAPDRVVLRAGTSFQGNGKRETGRREKPTSPSRSLSPFPRSYPTRTSIVCGLARSALGRVTVSTPCSNFASTRSTSTVFGRVKLRSKLP